MLAFRFCAVLLLFLAPFSPCRGSIIDDFEEGPFNLNASTELATSQAVTPGLHSMADTRYVTLVPTGEGASILAQFDPTSSAADHEMLCIFTGAGHLVLEYLTSPTDLTAGGMLGRLDVLVTLADPGKFDVSLELKDVGGASQSKSQTIPGIGLSSFFLNDFDVDITQIVGTRITFTTSNIGDLSVSDIRMRTVAGSVVSFDAQSASVSGPPYPTPSILFEGGPSSFPPSPVYPPSPILPVEILGLSLAEAKDAVSPNPVVATVLADDSGGGTGAPGVGKLTFLWNGAGSFPDSSFFDIATVPGPYGQILPSLGPPTIVDSGPKAFQVLFPVEHTEGGNPAGVTAHLLTFAIGNQPLVFESKEVSHPPDPGFTEFHTQFTLGQSRSRAAQGAAVVNPNEPLFTITLMADYGGPGAIVGIANLPEPNRRMVVAFPSLMTNYTRLRMTPPPEHQTEILIHDVLGRLVEQLPLSVEGEVIWRGTDRWGRSVSAGVYLIKVPDHSNATARVVKLR